MMLDCTPTFRVLPEAVNVPSPEPPEAEPEPAAGGGTAAARGQTGHLQLLPEALRSLFCIRVSFFQPPLI